MKSTYNFCYLTSNPLIYLCPKTCFTEHWKITTKDDLEKCSAVSLFPNFSMKYSNVHRIQHPYIL
jgi:hypothetical protein